jgi:hypothetical protein
VSRRTSLVRAKPGAAAESAAESSTSTPAPESTTLDPRVAELEALRAQDAAVIAKLRADLDNAVSQAVGLAEARDAAVAERDNAVAARASADVTIERLRTERTELEQRFQSDWNRREEELKMLIKSGRLPAVSADALPQTAPVKGKILRATCRLRTHTRGGERVTIEALQPIPAEVDVSTLDAGTFEEV